jgi:hypothetical protein
VISRRRRQVQYPDNGAYMVAAYIIVAVVVVAYAVSLVWRVKREK